MNFLVLVRRAMFPHRLMYWGNSNEATLRLGK